TSTSSPGSTALSRQAFGGRVRDELEKAAVRIPKVHARSRATRTHSLRGARDDLDAFRYEVVARLLGCAIPYEAEVAVARTNGVDGARFRRGPGSVDVELLLTDPVGPATSGQLDQFDADDVAIEGVGPGPIRHGYYDMVKLDNRHGRRVRKDALSSHKA